MEVDDEEQIKSCNFQKTQLRDWSMVVIRDSLPNNDCSIFPPCKHENLHLNSYPNREQEDPFSPSLSSSSSSSSFSPSDSDASDPDPELPLPSDSRVGKPFDGTGWMGIGIEVLRSKLLALASSFGYQFSIRSRACSFASGAGIAAVVMMLFSLYLRARQRRRLDNLMLIIKDKDEKNGKLLNQIAQLNEVLIAHHKLLASKVSS